MINNVNNLCDLNVDTIYKTNLRLIKFKFEEIKSKKLRNIAKYIWDLLFPLDSDGIIDKFHKKDVVKYCPLYSIVWQNDEFITGHRFATIMELNG